MKEYDFNRASLLLHVHEKTMGHPKLKPLMDAALDELHEMAAEAMSPAPRHKPKLFNEVEPGSEPEVDRRL